jgi:hypothetical protein
MESTSDNEALEPGLLTFLVDNMEEGGLLRVHPRFTNTDDYAETLGLLTDNADQGVQEELAKVSNMSPLSSQMPTDFWSPSPLVGKKRVHTKASKTTPQQEAKKVLWSISFTNFFRARQPRPRRA